MLGQTQPQLLALAAAQRCDTLAGGSEAVQEGAGGGKESAQEVKLKTLIGIGPAEDSQKVSETSTTTTRIGPTSQVSVPEDVEAGMNAKNAKVSDLEHGLVGEGGGQGGEAGGGGWNSMRKILEKEHAEARDRRESLLLDASRVQGRGRGNEVAGEGVGTGGVHGAGGRAPDTLSSGSPPPAPVAGVLAVANGGSLFVTTHRGRHADGECRREKGADERERERENVGLLAQVGVE